MPTTRPRHTVTETDALARALDDAARRWPEDRDNRVRLLLHLVDEGHRRVVSDEEQRVEQRRSAIRRTSGRLTGVFDEDYLEKLRNDWPA